MFDNFHKTDKIEISVWIGQSAVEVAIIAFDSLKLEIGGITIGGKQMIVKRQTLFSHSGGYGLGQVSPPCAKIKNALSRQVMR